MERGCRVIELPGKGKQTDRIHDLSSALNLPKPTIDRILSTLHCSEFVTHDGMLTAHCLGFRLSEMGRAVLNQFDRRQQAESVLSQLAGRV